MPVISGGVVAPGPAEVYIEEVTFTETTGAGTYTGTVTVPAGAWICDIKIQNTVLWTATTSATLNVGDGSDADGWYAAIDMKATDLLVGEELNFENPGGKPGVYLVTATGTRSASYAAAAKVVTATIATVGAAGSAGRTRMAVIYAMPATQTVAATKA